MTDQERYRKVIDIWTKTKAEIYAGLQKSLNEKHKDNSIFMMMDSGARGNISNFGQLAGMRGLMAKPNGESIEIPIKSAFMEGLTVSEFFTSTHGARKGLADTALKTADSGYLTRRLVDVAQDVIVREVDCGTDEGLRVKAIINTKDNTEIESLDRRIIGRYANKKVTDPETGEVLLVRNQIITEEIAIQIVEAGITEVEIRSVLSCSTSHGVCQKCYGRNLATGEVVEIGEAIGIMAAQSIGEPGTQLTMRTFHTGGVAGDDITQGLPRVQELFEARNPKARSIISEIAGVVATIEQLDHRYEITVKNDLEERSYLTPYSARLRVKEGQDVKPGQKLTEGSIDPKELLKVTDVRSVQSYILKEIQKVYSMQGVEISDKHVEVMSRRMLSKLRIIDPGSTPFLPGALVDMSDFTRENRKCLIESKNPAIGRPVLLGITKASLETESFLSAASFQETTRVLTDAAIKGKTDRLMGLKENVIIGKLIPAGTGAKMYRDVDLKIDRPEVEVDLTEFEEIVE
jgi:DNA-directed RNA polymerase subunit beta'